MSFHVVCFPRRVMGAHKTLHVAELSFCLRFGSITGLSDTAALWWLGCQVLGQPVAGGYPDCPQDRPRGEAAPPRGLERAHLEGIPGNAGTRCTGGCMALMRTIQANLAAGAGYRA